MLKSQLLQSVGALFVVIVILFLIIADPIGEASGKIVLLGLVSGFSVWSLLRHWRVADEVQLAATKFSFVTGAGVGLLTAFGFVIVMRHTPSVAEFIASTAALSNNELPVAAVGFALGSLSTMLLVMITGLVANAFWWSVRS